ncbi:AbrB/MazE/SpoVT family DNA-binding domain-containing protein [Cyanobium sp. ATX 6F1]|nr:AbrB/MazE/SpoVT family DNA-binding domain-containing protein [Cyanobium sp. ATX 6F1]
MDEAKIAKLFWTSRSQAVRLPKEFRFSGESVLVRRQGRAVILEPLEDWPEDYLESFQGVGDDFVRPDQGLLDERERLV